MRILWRKIQMRSWLLSKWRYRSRGLELNGRPSDRIWYFAYGANMHHSAFLERRGMRPLEWRVGKLSGYRLRFNLDGRPIGKAAPANISPDAAAEVWGVLYQITRRDMLRLDASEGVPGNRYRPVWLAMEDADGAPLTAMTYVAEGYEEDRRPSLRYLTLLREGARAHGLPDSWVSGLDSVEPAE
jgi:cation transport regulator ChaC